MTKVKAKDFMAAVGELNREYQAAVQRYVQMLPPGGFTPQDGIYQEAAMDVKELRDQIIGLVGGLLTPHSEGYGEMARASMKNLLRVGRKG
jgi:hypothetical protein